MRQARRKTSSLLAGLLVVCGIQSGRLDGTIKLLKISNIGLLGDGEVGVGESIADSRLRLDAR